MITLFYRNTLLFIFLVKMTVSSKYFKQYVLASHKVNHQVFPSETILTNINTSTSYAVYVAGEVFSIKVPASVEDDPYKIINWKVINSNPNRLMYISGTEAYIMINQVFKKKLDYPKGIIHSIIVLGNNEAIHIPTIVNPNSVQTNITWNYFELLHFDEKKEKIKIIEKIPWLDQDDWKYILEWKMLDHITIGTKMYILLKRKLKRFIGSQIEAADELFVTRLSLNVSDRFLESAVELNIRVSIDIYQAQFLIAFNASEKHRYSVVILGKHEAGHDISNRNFMPKLEASFDAVVTSCKETNVCNQMHQHLRSNSFDCNSNCPFGEQLYPTGTLELLIHKLRKVIPINATLLTYNVDYADVKFTLFYFYEGKLVFCEFKDFLHDSCYPLDGVKEEYIADLFLDVISGKFILLIGSGSARTLDLFAEYHCERFYNCADCIIYGLTFGCIWTGMTCKQHEPFQALKIREYTINYCFTIVSFSPDYFKEEVNILTIEFEETFGIKKRVEKIFISAGLENDCVNISLGNSNLTCKFNLWTSGNFILYVSLYNDAFLDSTPITAIPSKTVVIEANVNLGFTLAVLSIGIFVVAISVICLVIINITYLRTIILHRLDENTRNFRSRLTNYVRSTLDSEGSSFRSKTLKKLTLNRLRKKDPIIIK
uniref:Uncharacterized protein n=1 Tax=Tetranychus urticae TaxID=32264 RepID=T1KDY6_TETUR